MKNIFEIMKEYGLEIPEDKKKDFEKAVLENYKTVTDYDNQAKKLDAANDTIKANDTAMKDLQGKLDGFKDVDVSGLNQRIKDLEIEKANIQKDCDARIADRDFNDLVKEKHRCCQWQKCQGNYSFVGCGYAESVQEPERGHCCSTESTDRKRR
ncbi:MAG: hypothetical protein V8S42_07445 [Lachnospiraceae bacterium]